MRRRKWMGGEMKEGGVVGEGCMGAKKWMKLD